jgi:hypothetical protein
MKRFNHLAKMDFIEKEIQGEEDEIIHHKGKLVCKVSRKAKVGDYVRFHNLHHSYGFKGKTINGKLYKVFKPGGSEAGGVYFDEEGNERDVLGWDTNPNPDVFEICGVYDRAPYNSSEIAQSDQESLTINNLQAIVNRVQQLQVDKGVYRHQIINYYFGFECANIQLTEVAFLSIFPNYTQENYNGQYMKLTSMMNQVEFFCLQEKQP